MDKLKLEQEFVKLLEASANTNMLYFLLTLQASLDIELIMRFNSEINRITNALLLDRHRYGQAHPIPPQDALFLLQVNYESIAFYTCIRNFVNPILRQPADPFPWRQGEEYHIRKDGRIHFMKARIIDNLIVDLKSASCDFIASCFRDTHFGTIQFIRNAVAHSTFLAPNVGERADWMFAAIRDDGTGLRVDELVLAPEELQGLLRDFFNFRLAFFGAYAAMRKRFKGKSFDFEAENLMAPGQQLECRLDRGRVVIKYRGVPLWRMGWPGSSARRVSRGQASDFQSGESGDT